MAFGECSQPWVKFLSDLGYESFMQERKKCPPHNKKKQADGEEIF